ncbi:MAG: hypothetical protein ACOCT0_03825 [Halobacteriota archaeon]
MNKLSLALIVGGIALMAVGSGYEEVSTLQIMAVAGGFMLILGGILMLVKDAQSSKSDAKTPTDVPSRVRLVGVVVALASLGLPYVRVPLPTEAGAPVPSGRTPMSFLELVLATTSGGGVEVEVALLIFAGVVLFGAFVAVFHHLGGYVILFGGMGLTFILMELVSDDLVSLVTEEFEPGVWVAVFGGLIIIASSFLSYQE